MNATILVLPGDGIGPEVTAEAVRALSRVGELGGHRFEFETGLIGGAAIDEIGTPLPPETVQAARKSDAVLLGAVGGPRWTEPRPEAGLLGLRSELELFANLRPVRGMPGGPLRPELLEGVDLLFVRELTGGIYFGPRHEGEDQASDTMVYSRAEVERVARVAFEAARNRRGKVTSVDKANVLASSRLWRRVVSQTAEDYPDVELEHALVDSFAMHLVTRPAAYDVVLAGNLFGDILSDEAAVLGGSLGMLPSASLGSGTRGLYEPVHGSAPDIAGRGIANPGGALLSAAMLLRYSLGLEAEARLLERAVLEAAQCSGGSLFTRTFGELVLAGLETGGPVFVRKRRSFEPRDVKQREVSHG